MRETKGPMIRTKCKMKKAYSDYEIAGLKIFFKFFFLHVVTFKIKRNRIFEKSVFLFVTPLQQSACSSANACNHITL